MKKTFLLATVATSLFAFNANALDFQQYVSAKATYADVNNKGKIKDPDAGMSLSLDHKDNVWGSSFAYGIKTGAIRTELELNLHQDAKDTFINEADENTKLNVKNNSVFINAYYDIYTGTKFTPYVGGGIGIAKIRAKLVLPETGDSASESSNEFAWQLGAGVSYAATNNLAVDLGYRYADYGSLTVYKETSGFKNKVEPTSNEFYLGVRYAF